MIAVLQALFNLKNYRAAMEEIQPEQNTIESILKSIYKEMVERRGKSMTIDGYRKKICNY
ncbi:hypothetical protein THOM_0260 [Trachipleistophora hominis]|uniref:Uncharacterized protein n=1 Tax=Trachipleistophora hominis TaxID=72359 RepID=L7K074_TRAHO|nr:hypothetical protein THOM_0260 [Trachipleistophora hominis]